MIVALDGTPLTVSTGGVRRYTVELGRALAQEFAHDRFHWISDQPLQLPDAGASNLSAGNRLPANLLTRRWWLFGVQLEMNRLKADLFHGTDFAVPYLPMRPSVLTLHDLSPWKDPAWHHDAQRVRRRTPYLLRWGAATMIITPTEAVKREAIDRFRLREDRIVAVPEAASSLFRPVPPAEAERPYFLYVGTLEPRKNLSVVIEAWKSIQPSADLVLAGRRRADFPALPPQKGLRVLGEVDEEALPGLYAGAIASLYPSLYEGFGLPVLEAMQCGSPVIASRDPAILEVSGASAIHVDAGDTTAWIEAMRGLLANSTERNRRKELSLARAQAFSWKRTAQKTREVYVEALRRFAR